MYAKEEGRRSKEAHDWKEGLTGRKVKARHYSTLSSQHCTEHAQSMSMLCAACKGKQWLADAPYMTAAQDSSDKAFYFNVQVKLCVSLVVWCVRRF